ncbi:helix-turn-helix domain-containing protein [Agromyces subbeticus]|uniref:helix-turn-helix domain-containing protein n=1 Tax=Agromyces subbeticus TaxID=293890 RepID=UPI003CCC1F9A
MMSSSAGSKVPGSSVSQPARWRRSQIPEWTMADRLRKAREHARLEQRQLAELAGIARATVSNAERGAHIPHRATVRAWADACGVLVSWLETGRRS